MRVGCVGNIRRFCLSGAAFAALLLAGPVHAQSPGLRGPVSNDNTVTPASSAGRSPADATGSYQPDVSDSLAAARPGPSFQLRVTGDASESYVTNGYGSAGAQRPDYLSTLRLNTDLHEHSRRVDLDASYSVVGDFYAKSTVPTQVSNYLQALGSIDVVPDYFQW